MTNTTITQWARPVNAILFDLDGTLMHTAPDIAAAINLMLAGYKLPPVSETVVANRIGRGSPILVERVFSMLEVPMAAAQLHLALKAFQHHYGEIVGSHARLYPGVVDALGELRRMNLKLGIVTNKDYHLSLRLLQQFQISSLFDLVIGGDTLEARKPSPLPILHACDSLGVAVSEAIYIGDSPIDAEAANAAGIPIYCVPYGYREGHPLSFLDCDGFIDSLADIPQLLAGRFDADSRRAAGP